MSEKETMPDLDNLTPPNPEDCEWGENQEILLENKCSDNEDNDVTQHGSAEEGALEHDEDGGVINNG